ncbi:hypothetical protein Scep_030166 [Stephania cephalantha]|uniref:Uncharacterized protein n=1 Tax=Stephania cephalantha TaxID=152367 RepID=A0AAP0DZ12_9MAGN
MVGCREGKWPMKYLGLPVGGSPLRKEFLDSVVQKISHHIRVEKGAGCPKEEDSPCYKQSSQLYRRTSFHSSKSPMEWKEGLRL